MVDHQLYSGNGDTAHQAVYGKENLPIEGDNIPKDKQLPLLKPEANHGLLSEITLV